MTVNPPLSRSISTSEKSFWLLVRCDEQEHSFELPATVHRTLVIGTTRGADVSIASLPPVAFFVERVKHRVSLTPGYFSPDLKLNGNRFAHPSYLLASAVIELGRVRIELLLRESPPTERMVPLKKADRASSRVAEREDAFALAVSAVTARYSASELLQPAAYPTQTLEMPPFNFGDLPDEDVPSPSKPREAAMEELRVTTPLPRLESRGKSDTTAFDASLLKPVVAPGGVPNAEILESTAAKQAITKPQSSSPSSKRGERVSVGETETLTLLARLGVFTKRRPIVVVGYAALGAVVLSVFLVGVAQIATRSHRYRFSTAASRPVAPTQDAQAQASASPPSAGGDGSSGESKESTLLSASPPNRFAGFIVEQDASAAPRVTPPIGSAAVKQAGLDQAKRPAATPDEGEPDAPAREGHQTDRSTASDDPAIPAAVGHLIAGRLVEAEHAYRELAQRHEAQPAY
ncbi:MAG TPA: hypothetical protein VKP30_05845, partial [Polyangiaceae bacterium]|nr:hypothetical protein [Polyangiaceae bacterium]